MLRLTSLALKALLQSLVALQDFFELVVGFEEGFAIDDVLPYSRLVETFLESFSTLLDEPGEG